MESIPKLARERLRTQLPGTHPDADLLTAFAEHSLKGQERATLLEHLSVCADCRAVIALAQSTQPIPAAASNKFSWFSPPVLRWSAALAAILIVGAAVMFRGSHSALPAPSAARVALKSPSPAAQDLQNQALNQALKDGFITAQLTTKASQAASPAAPSAKIAALKPSLQEKKMHNKMVVRNDAPLKELAGPSPTSELDSTLMAYTGSAPQAGKLEEPPSPSAPVPSASESVEVAAAAPAVSADAGAEVSKAKQPAAQDRVASAGALQKNGVATTNMALNTRNISQSVQVSYPRWTLSADGSLQRSSDAGKTWEKVSVQEGAVFRAISALGPEVWVGGSAGLLFHSSDAGQNWTRITPATAAGTLAADIVSIKFTDPRHGKLVTTERHTWTTSDTGQTWQEQ